MNRSEILSVYNWGAVSPSGCGVQELWNHPPLKGQEPDVSSPTRWYEVFAVNRKWPQLLRWKDHPRLRRASSLSSFMVEAACQALGPSFGMDREGSLGVIACFGTGSVSLSHKFYAGFLATGKRFASPALFPETVYNASLSHLAAVISCSGPAYALVGDQTAWLAALRVARIWLNQGACQWVLVVGAEELDPIAIEAFVACGWLKRKSLFRPSEGAASLLLGPPGQEALCHLGPWWGEWPYRNRSQAAQAARKLAELIPPNAWVYRSAQNNWLAAMEAQVTGGRPACESPWYLGEAFTASAGWHIILAGLFARQKACPLYLPLWGLNYGIGLLKVLPPNENHSTSPHV
ncbi:beta-ketoacyl synthase N-terminal-like domain-containing protein [Candidatus Methylacidithermus pantelleriae]|uniref:Beta-ketoacyl synthase-like N-terminal domain-containing protein n=1 Tax=Candidatus Methylacidithermus pantelleriae TaxID=2744239 RepID=A0A8J2BTU3_9BACT|nr:beta-ketoacyl synthase N-terminal-like domain-containing protein [Candidatus Methylacidithermus pantelleriae]CAF0698737.1 hypothetical protein MPNT_30002 [Candidatus Methylacidithermus pantelleriae]